MSKKLLYESLKADLIALPQIKKAGLWNNHLERENVEHAFNYISGIISPSLFELPDFRDMRQSLITILLLILFILIEWKGREGSYALEQIGLEWRRPLRYLMYYSLIILIFWFSGNEQEFIYFQF